MKRSFAIIFSVVLIVGAAGLGGGLPLWGAFQSSSLVFNAGEAVRDLRIGELSSHATEDMSVADYLKSEICDATKMYGSCEADILVDVTYFHEVRDEKKDWQIVTNRSPMLNARLCASDIIRVKIERSEASKGVWYSRLFDHQLASSPRSSQIIAMHGDEFCP